MRKETQEHIFMSSSTRKRDKTCRWKLGLVRGITYLGFVMVEWGWHAELACCRSI